MRPLTLVLVGTVLAIAAVGVWSLQRASTAVDRQAARARLEAAIARCEAALGEAPDPASLVHGDRRRAGARLAAALAAGARLDRFARGAAPGTELAEALAACSGGGGDRAQWDLVLAQPEVGAALATLAQGGRGPRGAEPETRSRRGLALLGGALAVGARRALDEGDGEEFAGRFEASAGLAADLLGAGHGREWFPGVAAAARTLGLGRLEDTPGTTSAESARAAGARLAAELPGPYRERVRAAVLALRGRVPATARVILAEDLRLLRMFAASLESGSMEPGDALRGVEALEALRPERLAIADLEDLSAMAEASDALERRLREASKQLLSGRPAGPESVAPSLGVRGPYRTARQLAGVRENCDAFLGALSKGN